MRGRFKDESGQAIVEFALVLPVLLLVLCLILELSWSCSGRLAVANMAREGARAGSVCTTADAAALAEARALSMAPDYMAAGSQVQVSFSVPASIREGDIVVEVNAQLEPLTPLPGIIGRDELEVAAKCVMKMN